MNIGKINGYTCSELQTWLSQVRHRITHNESSSHNSNKEKIYIGIPYLPKISTKIKKVFQEVDIIMVDTPPFNMEKSLNQFKHYFNDKLDNSGVYQVECQCNKTYVGVTKRNIRTRIKEHILEILGK